MTLFIAPFISLFPGPLGWTSMQIFVPIDDEHTMFHFIQTRHDKPIDELTRSRRAKRSGMAARRRSRPAEYRKIRSQANNWLQDRAAMEGGSFTGIHGVNNEDIAMQESMGPIFDRTKEHLGTSDVAVIRMRRIMLDGVRAFVEDGAPPVGLAEPVAYETLHAGERMVRHGERWQAAMAVV